MNPSQSQEKPRVASDLHRTTPVSVVRLGPVQSLSTWSSRTTQAPRRRASVGRLVSSRRRRRERSSVWCWARPKTSLWAAVVPTYCYLRRRRRPRMPSIVTRDRPEATPPGRPSQPRPPGKHSRASYLSFVVVGGMQIIFVISMFPPKLW